VVKGEIYRVVVVIRVAYAVAVYAVVIYAVVIYAVIIYA